MRNNNVLAWGITAAAFFAPAVHGDIRLNPVNPPQLDKLKQPQPVVRPPAGELVKDENSTTLTPLFKQDNPEQGAFDLRWIPARVNAAIPRNFVVNGGIVQFDKVPKDQRGDFSEWLLTHARMYESASKGKELPPAQVAITNCVFLRETIPVADRTILDNALWAQMEILQALRHKEDAESKEKGFLAWERVMILTTVGADVRQAVPKLDKEGKPVLDAQNKPETMDLNQLLGFYPTVKLFPDWFVHYAYVLDTSDFVPVINLAWKESKALKWNDKFSAFIDRAVTRMDSEAMLKFLTVLDWQNVPEESLNEMVASLKKSKSSSIQDAVKAIDNRANLAENNYSPLRTHLNNIRVAVVAAKAKLLLENRPLPQR